MLQAHSFQLVLTFRIAMLESRIEARTAASG
jgi:hypothetical protein